MTLLRCSSLYTLFWVLVLNHAADHDTFKNCSRVPFCSDLRTRPPADDYYLDEDFMEISPDYQTITLHAISSINEDKELTVIMTSYSNDIFRLKITETNSSRYELEDVILPKTESVSVEGIMPIQILSDKIVASFASNMVVFHYSPFTVEFQKGDFTEVLFNGSRLSVAQNDDTAPFSFGIQFPEAQQLYGLHEHCETLALKTTSPGGTDPYRLKNSDVGGYEIESPMALYGSIPLLYGHGVNATAGVFLHNAAEQWIETTNGDDTQAYYMVETGTLDLFVLMGPTPKNVVQQYTRLTGTAPVPPLWSLGYHQSRFTYENQEDVKFVAKSFDENNFPLDAIWLDIDYTDGFRYFTWNPDTFSDPIDLQETLASTNKKLVAIIDPHVKAEPGYSFYDDAVKNDLFLKNADGTVYQGNAWPGSSAYLDFLNPEARQYYSKMFMYENFPKTTSTIAGIWNDMNEPSVFDSSTEMTVPPNALHTGNVTHREVHNIYGFLQTMATYQGLIDRDNGKIRPFILSRSHFAGSQRYSATWTGDNFADWPFLLAAFQECLNANIVGLVFCGSDVGGFFNDPSNELLERWYLAGAWLPFYRAHSEKSTTRREPYLLPEDSQAVIRGAIQTRYQHLPVWYTLFYEHARIGDPVIRPLFFEYPEDVDTYRIDNQVLVGSDILVRAITEPDVDSVDVYFPEGLWISVASGDVILGGGVTPVPVTRDTIPVFYRSGAVIVRKDTIRSNTVEMTTDPHTLYYTQDENGEAHGTVYLDDGTSFKYRDASDYNYIQIDVAGDNITWSTIDGDGDYEFVVEKVVRRDIIKRPEGGRPGTFQETVFTTDASGVPLKDLTYETTKKTILKLK